MTHEKETKDINTTNNNQAENSASSSSTNTTISEAEKEQRKAEFKAELIVVFKEYQKGKINYNVYQERFENISYWQKFRRDLTERERTKIWSEVWSEGQAGKKDSEEEEEQAEARTSGSTENNEQPQEVIISKGKEKEHEAPRQDLILPVVSNILNKEKLNILVIETTAEERAGRFKGRAEKNLKRYNEKMKRGEYDKLELEEMQEGRKWEEREPWFLKSAVSSAFGLSEKGQWELFDDFQLLRKASKIQDEITTMRLKEAVAYENEVIAGLEAISREVAEERKFNQQEKEAFIKELEKKEEEKGEIAEKSKRDIEDLEAKGKDIVEKFKKDREEKESELNGKIREAKAEASGLNQKLGEWQEKLNMKDQELAERLTKEGEELEEQKKLIESKERVEYNAIKEKYEELEKEAKGTAEQLEIKDQAISEYTRLIYQQKEDNEIQQAEYSILLKKWQLEINEVKRLGADIILHEKDKGVLRVELNSEKRQRQNDINERNREIQRITDSKNREIENQKADYEGQLRLKDSRLKDWEEAYLKWEEDRKEKHQELQKQTLEIRDLNKEINDFKFKKIDHDREIAEAKRENEHLTKINQDQAERLKELEPSAFYKFIDGFGFSKVKNLAVNVAVVIGLIGIIYAITLILKYLVKPTFSNLKGLIWSKKTKRIIEAEAEEDEETIFEAEPEARNSPPKSPERKKQATN